MSIMCTVKELRQKYQCIVRWGIHLGSMKYYIDDEVCRADADDAPVNAIYKQDNGEWKVAEGIADPLLMQQILGTS